MYVFLFCFVFALVFLFFIFYFGIAAPRAFGDEIDLLERTGTNLIDNSDSSIRGAFEACRDSVILGSKNNI